jgi:ankyrin repeat protein
VAVANDYGATPLHVAAAVGDVSVLDVLLLESDEKLGIYI